MKASASRSQLRTLRRSAAPLLAAAVSDLFPDILLVSGHSSDIDFSYDFIFSQQVDEKILPLIEEQMRALIKQALPMTKIEMMRKNAIEFLNYHNQPFQADYFSSIDDTLISLVKIGEFSDPCEGEVLKNTEEIGSIKLLDISHRSHLLSDDTEVIITHIQGTACSDPQSLKKHLKLFEKAKKFGHVVLGKELDLFSFPEGNQESAIWHPRGQAIRDNLSVWWKKTHEDQGFRFVSTIPYDFDAGHSYLFQSKERHPEEFPFRFAELSPNDEPNNEEFAGLFNSPTAWRDRATTYCLSEQVYQELISSLQFIDKITKIFGIEHRWVLAGRTSGKGIPRSGWDAACKQLTNALSACQIDYTTEGNAVEGPRVDLHFVDLLGREWTGSSIGIDLYTPAQFDLLYRSGDGKMMPPVVVRRSLFGSLERFIALLIEHFEGNFPLWLAPEWVRIMPLGLKNLRDARRVQEEFDAAGIRTGLDPRPDKLAAKIHAAECERVPYVAILGDNEAAAGVIAVRSCQGRSENQKMKVGEFLGKLKNEVTNPLTIKEIGSRLES